MAGGSAPPPPPGQPGWLWAAVAGAGAAACGGGLLLLARRRARRWRAARRAALGPAEAVALLPGETSALMMGLAPSVSTATFFSGYSKAASRTLRARLDAVLALNPWLLGWLDEDEGGRVVLMVPTDPEVVRRRAAECFRRCTAEGDGVALTSHTAFRDLWSALAGSGLLVPTGAQVLQDLGAPIFRVAVVDDAEAPRTKFALVASLSHVVADGHCFYKVFNMFSEGAKVEALSPARKPAVAAAAAGALHGDGGFLQNPSAGLQLSLVASILTGALVGPACEVELRYINEDFVKAEKARAMAAGQVRTRSSSAPRGSVAGTDTASTGLGQL